MQSSYIIPRGRRPLARGYFILLFGMLRLGHLHRLMKCDLVFSHPMNAWWCLDYETNTNILHGSYHKIIGFRKEAELWISEKNWLMTDLLHDTWSESDVFYERMQSLWVKRKNRFALVTSFRYALLLIQLRIRYERYDDRWQMVSELTVSQQLPPCE